MTWQAMTLREVRNWARREGSQRVTADYSAELIARHIDLLLQHSLEISAVELITQADTVLTAERISRVRFLISRFAQHEPLAYLLGTHEFCGREFIVTPDVLIPRPETEILVEKASEYLVQSSSPVTLIDIGVGSGAILLSLCQQFSQQSLRESLPHSLRLVSAVGIDRSVAALGVARLNTKRFGLEDRVDYFCGDLVGAINLEACRLNGGSSDSASQTSLLITANLPYIDPNEDLPRSVSEFEPRLALHAEAGGLRLIEQLIEQLAGQIRVTDRLFLEIGHAQFARVESRLLSSGFSVIKPHLDHQGIERIIEVGK